MNNLAVLYEEQFKDFKKAEKYYLMAIENKNAGAMNNLAVLFEEQFKDFKKAEKYYLMAIKQKNEDAIFRLAFLYQYDLKNYSKAEKYYLMAVENKNTIAMYNLALLYEEQFNNFKKAKTYYFMAIENDFKNYMENWLQTTFVNDEIRNYFLSIFKKYHKNTNHISLFALSLILIHAEKYKESIDYFYLFLDLIKDTDDFQKHITNFFILLISRKQHHLAFKLFEKEKYHLKEKIKPIYYALMKLMQDEYPKEYKRMGSEVYDTVKEVLEKIKELEK